MFALNSSFDAAQRCHPSRADVQLDSDPARFCRFSRIQLAGLLPQRRQASLHDAHGKLFCVRCFFGRRRREVPALSTFHRRNSRGNVYAGPQSGSLCRHSPARHPPSANGSWLSCFSSSIQTEARTSIFPPFLKTLLALRRQSLPYEGGALW
jgi:hypothetical protein